MPQALAFFALSITCNNCLVSGLVFKQAWINASSSAPAFTSQTPASAGFSASGALFCDINHHAAAPPAINKSINKTQINGLFFFSCAAAGTTGSIGISVITGCSITGSGIGCDSIIGSSAFVSVTAAGSTISRTSSPRKESPPAEEARILPTKRMTPRSVKSPLLANNRYWVLPTCCTSASTNQGPSVPLSASPLSIKSAIRCHTGSGFHCSPWAK